MSDELNKILDVHLSIYMWRWVMAVHTQERLPGKWKVYYEHAHVPVSAVYSVTTWWRSCSRHSVWWAWGLQMECVVSIALIPLLGLYMSISYTDFLHKLHDYISLWNWLSSLMVWEHDTSSLRCSCINRIQFVQPEKLLFNKDMSNKLGFLYSEGYSMLWKRFEMMLWNSLVFHSHKCLTGNQSATFKLSACKIITEQLYSTIEKNRVVSLRQSYQFKAY